jgi:hypothetical protein
MVMKMLEKMRRITVHMEAFYPDGKCWAAKLDSAGVWARER